MNNLDISKPYDGQDAVTFGNGKGESTRNIGHKYLTVSNRQFSQKYFTCT
jgi:hypothetical protein